MVLVESVLVEVWVAALVWLVVAKSALVEAEISELASELGEEQLVSKEPIAVLPARLASSREAGWLAE